MKLMFYLIFEVVLIGLSGLVAFYGPDTTTAHSPKKDQSSEFWGLQGEQIQRPKQRGVRRLKKPWLLLKKNTQKLMNIKGGTPHSYICITDKKIFYRQLLSSHQ